MALKERTVISGAHKLPNGEWKISHVKEFYESSITPVEASNDKDGNLIPAVTDVRNQGLPHITTIYNGQKVPADVQAFLDK